MAGRHGGARRGAGRPKGNVTAAKLLIAEAAQEHATDALSVLVAIAKDPEAPASARVSAATHILDRGYGKPVTPPEAETTDRLTLALIEISKRGSAAPIATTRGAEQD